MKLSSLIKKLSIALVAVLMLTSNVDAMAPNNGSTDGRTQKTTKQIRTETLDAIDQKIAKAKGVLDAASKEYNTYFNYELYKKANNANDQLALAIKLNFVIEKNAVKLLNGNPLTKDTSNNEIEFNATEWNNKDHNKLLKNMNDAQIRYNKALGKQPGRFNKSLMYFTGKVPSKTQTAFAGVLVTAVVTAVVAAVAKAIKYGLDKNKSKKAEAVKAKLNEVLNSGKIETSLIQNEDAKLQVEAFFAAANDEEKAQIIAKIAEIALQETELMDAIQNAVSPTVIA